MSEIKITVEGPVGSGKSALLGEIEILCKALGVPVRYADPAAAASEKAMTHADWITYLEMYKPSVVLHEKGPDRAALASTPVAGEAQPKPDTSEADASPIVPGGPYTDPEDLIATLDAAPQASEAVLEAIQFVLKNFKASEAQGYHTRDRQFAISILEQALSAQPGAQNDAN